MLKIFRYLIINQSVGKHLNPMMAIDDQKSNFFCFSVQATELTSLGTRLTSTESKTSDMEKKNAGILLTNIII